MNEGDPAQQVATTEPPQTSTPPSVAMQEDSPPPTIAAVLSSNGPSCPAAVTASSTIANEAELEAFSRTPASERRMSPALRGVLAEVALTGRVRYQWCLMRPLVDFALEQVLIQYQPPSSEEGSEMQYGPDRGTAFGGDEDLQSTLARFRKILSGFSQAPWTLQRLCELLLEPRKQYQVLRKVTLALERCLLITGELLPPSPALIPALPLLSSLGPVNNCLPNPPHGAAAVAAAAAAARNSNSSLAAAADINPDQPSTSSTAANVALPPPPLRSSTNGPEDGSAFTHTLIDVRAPLPTAPPPSAAHHHTSPVHQNPLLNQQPREHISPGASNINHNHYQQPPTSPGTAAVMAAKEARNHMEHLEEDHWPEPVVHPPHSPHRSPNRMPHTPSSHHHSVSPVSVARTGSISPPGPRSPTVLASAAAAAAAASHSWPLHGHQHDHSHHDVYSPTHMEAPASPHAATSRTSSSPLSGGHKSVSSPVQAAGSASSADVDMFQSDSPSLSRPAAAAAGRATSQAAAAKPSAEPAMDAMEEEVGYITVQIVPPPPQSDQTPARHASFDAAASTPATAASTSAAAAVLLPSTAQVGGSDPMVACDEGSNAALGAAVGDAEGVPCSPDGGEQELAVSAGPAGVVMNRVASEEVEPASKQARLTREEGPGGSLP